MSLAELRASLGDAIREREWKSVEIIQGQIDEAERASLAAKVTPIESARRKR